MDEREGVGSVRYSQDIDDAGESCPLWVSPLKSLSDSGAKKVECPLWVVCTRYVGEVNARLDGCCVHTEGCERYGTLQERKREGLAFHWTPGKGKLRI